MSHQAWAGPLLDQRPAAEDRVWNRIPDVVRGNVIELALVEPSLSPRELAVRFTDTENYFISEASVYRLLKARELIAGPAFIVIKAADAFKDKKFVHLGRIANRGPLHSFDVIESPGKNKAGGLQRLGRLFAKGIGGDRDVFARASARGPIIEPRHR